MNNPCSPTRGELALAFLSVHEFDGMGTVGGLLVLNDRARPLEFHCTTPIQPSRSQRILYGTTLHAYLWGEEIAVALLRRARAKIVLAMTDTAPMLAARSTWGGALCLLGKTPPSVPVHPGGAADRSVESEAPLHPFEVGPFHCWSLLSHADDANLVNSFWEQSTRFDLLEPFDRLRQAVEEAHRSQAA